MRHAMIRTLGIFMLTFLTAVTFGQSFEGMVVYRNIYTSKIPNLSSEQFTAMMGSTQEYYIKNGNYKSIANGNAFQYQLYVNRENRLYTKMANAEYLLWNDGATNPDEVLKVEVNKGVVEILGYLCDELILTCKTGVQKYYFNTKLAVDKDLFAKHQFGNWYAFVSQSNSLPLKSIIENGQFILETVAVEVKSLKIEDAFFDLPAGAKTMKSPY